LEIFGPLLQQRVDQIDASYQSKPAMRYHGRRPLQVDIPLGTQKVTFSPGNSLVSSRVPKVLTLGQLGLPGGLDDQVNYFNASTQQYETALYDGAQWSTPSGDPSTISISPGEALFNFNSGISAKSCDGILWVSRLREIRRDARIASLPLRASR
jgi:hypothetical protein